MRAGGRRGISCVLCSSIRTNNREQASCAPCSAGDKHSSFLLLRKSAAHSHTSNPAPEVIDRPHHSDTRLRIHPQDCRRSERIMISRIHRDASRPRSWRRAAPGSLTIERSHPHLETSADISPQRESTASGSFSFLFCVKALLWSLGGCQVRHSFSCICRSEQAREHQRSRN